MLTFTMTLILWCHSFWSIGGLNLVKLDMVKTMELPKAQRRRDYLRPLWLFGMILYIMSQLIGSTLALEFLRAGLDSSLRLVVHELTPLHRICRPTRKLESRIQFHLCQVIYRLLPIPSTPVRLVISRLFSLCLSTTANGFLAGWSALL